jgi:hypothetical protein
VLSAVVVRWSRSRMRYERSGILVEEPALEQAEQECLADEDARMRRRERDRERRADEDVELQARIMCEAAAGLQTMPWAFYVTWLDGVQQVTEYDANLSSISAS